MSRASLESAELPRAHRARSWNSGSPMLPNSAPTLGASLHGSKLRVQAIPYWQRAGERANERAAHAEAITYFSKGLELLKATPDTSECLQRKLSAIHSPGPDSERRKGLWRSRGGTSLYPSAGAVQTYRRGAAALLDPVGIVDLFRRRAELQTARELGQQLLEMAQRAQDSVLLVRPTMLWASPVFWMGEFDPARLHLEHGIEQYDLHGITPMYAF